MGDVLSNRPGARVPSKLWLRWTAPAWILPALLAGVLVGGACASTSPSNTAQVPARTTQTTTQAETATPARTIEALELREGAPGAFLEMTADSPLVWTSYRDDAGRLVIELPNTNLGPQVRDLAAEAGVIASVRVEQEDFASRPLARLVVTTRGEAEHRLASEGRMLTVELTPVNGETVQVADVAKADEAAPEENLDSTVYEPLPREAEAVQAEVETESLAFEDLPEEDVQDPQASEEPVAIAEISDPAPMEQAAVEPTSADPATGEQTPRVIEPPARTGLGAGTPATILDRVTVVTTDDGTEVEIAGDGDFQYTLLQLDGPPRFVVDLEGVVNTSSRSAIEVGGEQLRRVRVAQFQSYPNPVSRVVFDMESSRLPEIVHTASGLFVRFGDYGASAPMMEAAGEPTMEAATAPSEVAQEEGFSMEPMDAEPTAVEAEVHGEVVAVPPAEPAAPYAEPEPAEIRMAATPAVATPEGMEPETEVAAAMEVPVIEEPPPAYEPEATLEVAVGDAYDSDTGETYDDDAYQSEPAATSDVALFEAVEVQYSEPQEAQASSQTTEIEPRVVGGAGNAYRGDPINLSLKDADIKDVLRSFSTITGLNIAVHPGVAGSVTVELTEVPWDQALDLILRLNNLNYVLEGNIMRVATTSQLAQETEEKRRLQEAQANQIPLQTVIRSISYAGADDIARLLTSGLSGGSGGRGGGNRRNQSILSRRGSITVDDRTNKLIIKELPSNMNTVLAIIENLDTAEPQVLIEARIVETTKQFSRTIGINWAFNAVADDQFGNTTGLQFPHRGTANGGVQLLTGGQNGFLDISLGNILDTFTLDMNLLAAENEGLVSILSAPKIATLNNERARIQSGLQIPIQTVANNTVSVQFVNATLELDVTPHVTAEGTVLMEIDIAKRAPQPAFAIAGATNAPISTKEARTRVLVRDGGTTVIGGIYEVTNNTGEDRVPGLANIPLLGHLFKNRSRSNTNEELLIFITPRVIRL